MTLRDARHPFLVFASGKLTPRLRLWFLLVGCFVIVQTFDRLALLIWSGATKAGVGAGLAAVVAYGLLEDAAIGLSMGLPFLVGLVLFRRWLGGKVLAVASHLLLLAMSVAWLQRRRDPVLERIRQPLQLDRGQSPDVSARVVGNIGSRSRGTLLPMFIPARRCILRRPALVRRWSRRRSGERQPGRRRDVSVKRRRLAHRFPSATRTELAEIATNGLHSLVPRR